MVSMRGPAQTLGSRHCTSGVSVDSVKATAGRSSTVREGLGGANIGRVRAALKGRLGPVRNTAVICLLGLLPDSLL